MERKGDSREAHNESKGERPGKDYHDHPRGDRHPECVMTGARVLTLALRGGVRGSPIPGSAEPPTHPHTYTHVREPALGSTGLFSIQAPHTSARLRKP
jgi:hypothetical protein